MGKLIKFFSKFKNSDNLTTAESYSFWFGLVGTIIGIIVVGSKKEEDEEEEE